MALPVLHKRGDIVMMVAFDSPTTYVNFCGATSISLNLENAVSEVRVGDCEDWSLPTRVIASYGAQTVNATVNAQLARSNRDRLLRWAKDQIALPVRLHIVSAPSGEVEYIDGMGMLATLNVENIGSTDDGAVVTTTLNIRFEDGVEFINSGQVLTAPQFTSMPSLLGSTALGGTITINLGAASGVPAPVLSGTLSRPGVSPVAVTQGQQITIASGDQGGSLSLTAVATNSQGTDTETVARSVPAAEPTTAPAITSSPVITGSATAGGTLSSTLGAASGNPAPNATRQWLADGVAIAGATGATLDTTGRAGQSISLRVTWSNGIGSTAVATSNAIAIVAAATAPVPFAAGDWSLATGLEANQLVVNIASLPANGGSQITAIQYSANGGTWTALPGGAGTGPRTLTMPAAATSYSIRLRAVNAVGNSTPGDTKTATSGAAGAPAIDAIVVIGASLMNSMFGRSLTTPHATATSLLQAAGHNLPVYGWATNGAQLAESDDHYTAARAAFPNALILSHFGGGNVTSIRPYPGGQAAFEAGLGELLAVAAGDTRFYPASMSFRDYDDTTFITPANGSKPYNENLLIPWIAANFPHAMASYGRPKLDYYRRVLQDFETWLVADNIHLTSTGITQFRQWIVSRIADLLNGAIPAEITERVYVAPEPEPGVYPLSIINFTGETFGSEFQAPRNNVFGNAATVNPNPLPNILDVDGNPTGLSLSHGYTGNPAIGATAPGRGANNNGNVGGLPAYNGTLLSANVVGSSAYITTGVTMPMTISGAVPGAQYEFGIVGSRNAADVRNTTVTIAGTPTTWNTSEATPQERRVTVTAAADGTIPIVVAPAGAALAYLGGLSIRRLPAA
ncbi:hypothetical protein LZ686_00575 [Paracoccus sp. NFXS7]|uniref:hypothetical protein n=1 Tax=Paracoccus sp. NFXS7 TaxID=2908653 RepID=UPI0032DF2181